jgi:hypothetical protein
MDNLIGLLIASLTSAALMHLWFRTDFVAEYLTLFRVNFILNSWTAWAETKKEDKQADVSFNTFVRAKVGSFFGKLLACPHCLCFWTSFFSALIFSQWYFVLAVYPAAMYFFIKIGANPISVALEAMIQESRINRIMAMQQQMMAQQRGAPSNSNPSFNFPPVQPPEEVSKALAQISKNAPL